MVTMARSLKHEVENGSLQKTEIDQDRISLHKDDVGRKTKTEVAYRPERKDLVRSQSPWTDISDDEQSNPKLYSMLTSLDESDTRCYQNSR